MNRRVSHLASAIGVVLAVLCSPVLAKQGKPGGTMQLVSIDLSNGNITVSDAAGQNAATYALTAMTAVTINGQPAKLSDLRRGMHVYLSVSHGGKTADKIDATSSSPPSPGPITVTKPTPAPPPPLTAPAPTVDLISSNAFWNLLNEDQRRVVQSTGRQFRNLLDARTFDDWSPTRRATLEQHALDALNGPQATEYQAISRLGALRSTKAVPRLRELAFNRQEGNNRVRWLAVRALGMIGDKSVVPDMIHLLYHRNLDTRWWAQISLVDLTGQNFGKDWNAWGNWWNAQHGQPPFNPQIIRWWSGQPEPNQLARSLDESDRQHFQNLSSP
jgi:hypothetical protein